MSSEEECLFANVNMTGQVPLDAHVIVIVLLPRNFMIRICMLLETQSRNFHVQCRLVGSLTLNTAVWPRLFTLFLDIPRRERTFPQISKRQPLAKRKPVM